MRYLLGIGLGLVALVGCASAPVERSVAAASAEDAPASADCGGAAGQARLKATFDRTSTCALSAVTAGFGDEFKVAGQALSDTKRIASVIRGFAAAIQVTDVSTARAIMCVRAVGGYADDQSVKDILTAAAVGLDAKTIDDLVDAVSDTFSVGVAGTFSSMNKAVANPTVDNVVAFLTAFANNVADVATLVNACEPLLEPFGAVSLPSVADYGAKLAQVGVIASIAQCGVTVIENAVDVGSELACYAQDLDNLAQQNADLQSSNDDRCAAFADYAQDPALLPILQSGGDGSDARKASCYQVMHHWGSCVYDAHRDGTFGSTALTCDECRTVCGGYVNGAGPNAYLQPVLDGAYANSGADTQTAQNLVMAASTCAAQVLPDGIQPCINFCRGQVADCP